MLFSSPASAQGSPITGIGPWKEQTDYGAATGSSGTGGVTILGQSCVAYQSSVYCVGGQNLKNIASPDSSDVFYAQVSSDGTVDSWAETTDYGAASGTSGSGGVGVGWPSCVQYNGYIYCVGGAASSGIVSDVFYAQLTSSGVGSWMETTDYGAGSGNTGGGGVKAFQLSCVADGGYIYCSGGGTSKVFYAQLSSSGVGPWTETIDYGASTGNTGAGGIAISSQVCTDSSGTIYCVGGTVSFSPVSDVFYAQLSASGVGPWTEATDYGATSGNSGSGGVPIYGTSCLVYSANVICIAGDTTKGATSSKVFHAADPAISLVWIEDADYPYGGYWWACVEIFGYVICTGGGSSTTESGGIQSGSTTTSSSSSSSTTSTSTSTSVTQSSTSSSSSSSSSTMPSTSFVSVSSSSGETTRTSIPVGQPTTASGGGAGTGGDAWENLIEWNEKYTGILVYTPDFGYLGILVAGTIYFFRYRGDREKTWKYKDKYELPKEEKKEGGGSDEVM